MTKHLELANNIRKALDKDWMPELEFYNLHFTLGAIYNIPFLEIEDKNRIVCYIIYAYSPDSLWLDLNKDRTELKRRILDNLGANTKEESFKQIINDRNDIAGMCIFNFLEEIKDWRWPIIFNLLDYSSKMQRFANTDTEIEISWEEMNKDGNKETLKEDLDIAKIVSVNKQKGDLLTIAIEKRKQAQVLLEEVKKDFLQTDIATQADFNFSFAETTKKRDILSWRLFLKSRKETLSPVT